MHPRMQNGIIEIHEKKICDIILHPLQKIINRQKFSSTEILGHFLKAEDVSPLNNSRPS